MRRGNVIANLDWLTIIIYLVMIVMGWLNIFSAVYSGDDPSIFDLNQRYGKQFLWILAAIVIAVIILMIDHKFYDFFAYIIYGLAVFLLILVLLVGKEINGAKSWFALGAFQIQPSEFAKPAVALALAKYLSGFNVKISHFRTFFISIVIIFTPAVLILLQPDTGSALVYFAFFLPIYREGFPVYILLSLLGLIVIFFAVLIFPPLYVLILLLGLGLIAWWYVSGSAKKTFLALMTLLISFALVYGINYLINKELDLYSVLLISSGISALFFLIRIFLAKISNAFLIISLAVAGILYSFTVDYAFHHLLSEYQQQRINTLLGVQSDLQGAGYNVNQSKIAIGSGGFSGKGFLNGTQTKLHFVPEQSTDFIFCTVGEEWGFLGSFFVIGLFGLLMIRIIQLAERQRSKFARIYGYGVLSVLLVHFFVNIAMTIGLFPVIGIPLPFFSYGGSSLWAFTTLLFIFLRLDASRTEYMR